MGSAREAQALALAAASREGLGMTHLGSCIHSALGASPDRPQRKWLWEHWERKVSAWALPSAHSPLIELLTPGNPLP